MKQKGSQEHDDVFRYLKSRVTWKKFYILEDLVWRYAYLINLFEHKELDKALDIDPVFVSKDLVEADKEKFSNVVKRNVDGFSIWDHEDAVMFVMEVSGMKKHLCDAAVVIHEYQCTQFSDHVFNGQLYLNRLLEQGYDSVEERKCIETNIFTKKAQIENYLSRLSPEMYSSIDAVITHYGDLHANLIGLVFKDEPPVELAAQDIIKFYNYIGFQEDEVDIWESKKAAVFMVEHWGVSYAGCIAMMWVNSFERLCCPTLKHAYLEAIEEIDDFEKEYGAVFSGGFPAQVCDAKAFHQESERSI